MRVYSYVIVIGSLALLFACLLINIINFSIENGFRINSSIISLVGDDDELIDDSVNNDSKSFLSKQVIKNILTFESISLTFLTNSAQIIIIVKYVQTCNLLLI